MSGSDSQVVDNTPCQPTEVREVNVIDSLGPAIFRFSSRWDNKAEAALVASLCGARRKTW